MVWNSISRIGAIPVSLLHSLSDRVIYLGHLSYQLTRQLIEVTRLLVHHVASVDPSKAKNDDFPKLLALHVLPSSVDPADPANSSLHSLLFRFITKMVEGRVSPGTLFEMMIYLLTTTTLTSDVNLSASPIHLNEVRSYTNASVPLPIPLPSLPLSFLLDQTIFDLNNKTVGIALPGGAVAAQVFGAALLSALEAKGLLTDKYIDIIVSVSGGGWVSPLAGTERFDLEGKKISKIDDLSTFLGEYVPPESLTLSSFTEPKPRDHLLSNADNYWNAFTVFFNFLKNLGDPEIPRILKGPYAMIQDSYEQFGYFSKRSLFCASIEEVNSILRHNPDLRDKIDSYYLPRKGFPLIATGFSALYPASGGLDAYESAGIGLEANAYAAGCLAAREQKMYNKKIPTDVLEYGGAVANYAFFQDENGNIPSPAYLFSLPTSAALSAFFIGGAASAIPELDNYTCVIRPYGFSDQVSLVDGGLYDNTGLTQLLAKRIKHCFVLASLGDRMDLKDPANFKNQSITTPFGLSNQTYIYTTPPLNPDDFDDTIQGICGSTNGIYTRTYLTQHCPELSITPYEVTITWINNVVDEWESKLTPEVRDYVRTIPHFPFPNSLVRFVFMTRAHVNAAYYSLQYKVYNHLTDLVRDAKR